jgi:cytochrome c
MDAMTCQSSAAKAALVLLLAIPVTVAAAGDPGRGARAFSQCMACHSVEPERHLTGPSLSHVWGKKAASVESFMRYSDALKRSGLVWDEQTLDKWLTNPQAFVPGTSMTFPGVKDPAVRADLIAYLQEPRTDRFTKYGNTTCA